MYFLVMPHRVRRVNRRAWLAAQTHCPNTTANARARRNPPNVMDFDMVDYDARKVFTSLKTKGFCASNPPYNSSTITIPVMPRRVPEVLAEIAR
jgi:hypothetical protein